MAPGNSPGILSISGNYVQGAAATLEIELGGTVAGSEFDQVAVTADATVSGTLDVEVISGFTPALGDQFDIITANMVSGTFDTYNAPVLPGDLVLHLLYEPTVVTLAAGVLGDADLDGDSDAADIDRIYAEFANPTTWNPADLDFDGDADQDDVTKLVQDLLNTDYGDANLDMSVDLADFNAWLASGGGGWAEADFNGDGFIDLADFNIWLTTVPPDAPLLNAVPVPEPTTMALFGLVGLLAAGRRRVTPPIRGSV